MNQSQESMTDQLWELVNLANKNGLYDAADYVRAQLSSSPEKSIQDFTAILCPEIRGGDVVTSKSVNLWDAAERIRDYWNKNAR